MYEVELELINWVTVQKINSNTSNQSYDLT